MFSLRGWTSFLIPGLAYLFLFYAGNIESLSSESIPVWAGTAWVAGNNGTIPTNAVLGGYDRDIPVFPARAVLDEGIINGKAIKGRTAYIPIAGIGIIKDEYEVLTVRHPDMVSWVPMNGPCESGVPKRAIAGGITTSGELLYIGRIDYNDHILAVGKVTPSDGCGLNISISYIEYRFYQYEILVINY